MTIERLRASDDIAATLRGRRQCGRRHVVVFARTRDDAGPPRVAVVASRRVGGAVQRNRAKRVLREAARTIDWAPATDIVLVARAAAARVPAAAVAADVHGCARSLGLEVPA